MKIPKGLNYTEYRANFLGIFVGVARWLGSHTDEPTSRRATKL